MVGVEQARRSDRLQTELHRHDQRKDQPALCAHDTRNWLLPGGFAAGLVRCWQFSRIAKRGAEVRSCEQTPALPAIKGHSQYIFAGHSRPSRSVVMRWRGSS